MRIMILFLALCLASLPCAQAAMAPDAGNVSAGKNADAKTNKPDTKADGKTDAKAADAKTAGANAGDAATENAPGEYSCQYYKVKLPEDWKAILPPQDKQGTVSAIFAASTGNVIVTIIIAPNSGADAATIAAMFAEQFKASRPPLEKNGLFTFNFPLQGSTVQAFVGTKDKVFAVTTINGNSRVARNFIRDNIESGELAAILPR